MLAASFPLCDFLNPISADAPCGVDIRKDTSAQSAYHQLKDARTRARQLERQQLQGEKTSSVSHWNQVFEQASSILLHVSKDLEVLAWLTEAAVRKTAIKGLNAGFRITLALVEKFWTHLHPLKDEEEGYNYRLAALTGLNGLEKEGSLITALNAVLITNSAVTSAYPLWQYQQSLAVERMSDVKKRQHYYAEGIPPLGQVKEAIFASGRHYYTEQLAFVNEALTTYEALNKLLAEKAGEQAPPSTYIKDSLLNIKTHLDMAANSFSTKAIAEKANKLTESKPSKSANTVINEREAKLNEITRIADFFKTTEPHTPLISLLERAVDWGRLSFPELIKEIIHDEQACEKTLKFIGANKH